MKLYSFLKLAGYLNASIGNLKTSDFKRGKYYGYFFTLC